MFKRGGKHFEYGKLVRLKDNGDKGSLHASLAWEFFLPTTKKVHAFGCRLASSQNKNILDLNDKNRRIYCGAYRLSASAIRALAKVNDINEISSADVVHKIENGEISHVDLRISLKLEALDIEGTKTMIVDRIWNACSGPLKHIADCDQDVESHPSTLLKIPPSGPYCDNRSSIERLFNLIRYKIYYCAFCIFCKEKLNQM